MKQLTLSLFFVLIVAGWTSAENIIHGDPPEKCPSPEKCASCHVNDRFFNEMRASAHGELTCFDCHLPGVVQKNKYERTDRGFNRLGYYMEDGNWRETEGNDVCLRCHSDKNTKDEGRSCWSCHMPENGEDAIVFQKVKTEPPKGDNIREIKKMPHRSHLFRYH